MTDFESALEEVARGNVMTRPSWPVGEGLYLYLTPTPYGPVPAWRTTYTLTEEDLFAEDWEVLSRVQ